MKLLRGHFLSSSFAFISFFSKPLGIFTPTRREGSLKAEAVPGNESFVEVRKNREVAVLRDRRTTSTGEEEE